MTQEAKVKVVLKEPIKMGDEMIKEINFRKPRAKDMRSMAIPLTTNDLFNIAVSIGDQPKFLIDELCAEDALKVIEVVSVFLSGGQKTGENA